MINLTKRIKKLFEGYDLSMDVRERKGCQTALNDQPIANISDNEDDNDDETANSDTPRFEFDALTASRPASGTIPRDFIHQRQFQPNCPPPNINQYCFIPQQQFQPNHATTDTIPRDFISQQQLHFGNTTSLLYGCNFSYPEPDRVIDLFRLIVIVVIVLMSFGVSRQAIKFPNEDWSWHSVKNIFLEPYFMIYGEVYAEDIDPPCNRTADPSAPGCQFGHFITPITMTAFLLVCNILLLSMLMAQFTSTFMRLSRLSDQVWKFQRYHTILQYEQKPLLAPPLIIFSHIFLLIKTIYRICRHRKRTFYRGLKLFLSVKEIEKLRDFEEECVHEYLLAKEDKEKSTVEERMLTTSDRVSHMLTRVETLKRNSVQQTSCFHNFDERLQRLEDMQTSTIELLNVLIQKVQTSSHDQATSIENISTKSYDKENKETDDDEMLTFTAVSSPDDIKMPTSSLLSSGASRMIHSSSFSNRKGTNPIPIPVSAPPQIVVGSYTEFLSMKNIAPTTLPTNDDRLGIGPTALSASSSSINVIDEINYPGLYEAEETEHNIFGKLIKDRFRKLSEVVEDIERTLPRHQQRQDEKRDKCDMIDDDETLSTMDWVDTTGRVAYNSAHVSRFDVSQDEDGQHLMATVIQHVHETDKGSVPDVLIHSPNDENTQSI
ncbi:unnamed protein product [Rotaria socialis]|uniref:Uncharacterized protein n=1 Tax=Rotaria socialis TaxID=392032 RepID=A0A819A2T6_9BILA|nr:unnamed protein product [Rotaria socialis]